MCSVCLMIAARGRLQLDSAHSGPESSDDDGGAPDPVQSLSGCKGVNPLTKEECVIKQSPQTVSQQPVGGVGRVPEETNQAVVRASDSEQSQKDMSCTCERIL